MSLVSTQKTLVLCFMYKLIKLQTSFHIYIAIAYTGPYHEINFQQLTFSNDITILNN